MLSKCREKRHLDHAKKTYKSDDIIVLNNFLQVFSCVEFCSQCQWLFLPPVEVDHPSTHLT